jgi:hypothetical protein
MSLNWPRHIEEALKLPLQVTWRKVKRKVHNRLKRDVGRLHAQFLGTEITDAGFLQSLNDHYVDAQGFIDYLAVRREPKFFLNFTQRQDFVDAIHELCPEAKPHTIATADQACDHILDLLGSGPTHLGEQIDWHVDFKTGHYFAPQLYYADIRPAPYPGGYDIKVPWELSRCQHFAWLGQAYWFTEDEKYAQEFVDQVLDWIEQNPPQFGVNWACTMDVAIRVVNWLWGYHFFKDSPSLGNDFLLTFFKSLLVHGRHIWRNLENQGDFTGNHYLSDLLGLVYLGILCPEFKEAQRWREFGLQELEKEMFKQVYPDGVDFEASTSYHRLVTEMFLSAVLLARLNGHVFSQPFMARLEKMVEFVMYITKPDGTAPLIGDNDNGRLHRLKVWEPPEREWVDFRYLLAIGAVLFEREDFAQAAGDQWEEAIWLLEWDAVEFKQSVENRNLPPPKLRSCGFEDAGVYIMQDSDLYVAVEAGPVGQNGKGGHSHNDTLSFEFYGKGQLWFLDPGMPVYTADYKKRNDFRSTKLHNTIMVDGMEQNHLDPHTPFRIEESIAPETVSWMIESKFSAFEAIYGGYRRLSDPVIQKRYIQLESVPFRFLMRDEITAKSKHSYLMNFQLGPKVKIHQDSELSVLLSPLSDHRGLKIHFHLLHGSVQTPVLKAKEGQIALGYGLCFPAPVLRLTWESVGAIIWEMEVLEVNV